MSTTSRMMALQEWEGVVEALDKDQGTFVALVYDLAREGEEIAELFVEDVSEDDRELLRPGAIFRWLIGYRNQNSGKRERVHSIVFRRMPAWSKPAIEKARAEAKKSANALQWR